MSLSKRLLSVADFVKEGSFIADVGSDHAEVPLYLLKEKKIAGAEAIENKIGPYSRMEKAIKSSPYADKCVLSLSDGIRVLDQRVNTLILAGMGGPLIERILTQGKGKLGQIDSLVVDAHNERAHLIGFLGQLSFELEDNVFFQEQGIAYDVMLWKKSPDPVFYQEREKTFGPLNLKRKPKEWINYWEMEEKRYTGLLEGNLPEKKRREYQAMVQTIEEALQK